MKSGIIHESNRASEYFAILVANESRWWELIDELNDDQKWHYITTKPGSRQDAIDTFGAAVMMCSRAQKDEGIWLIKSSFHCFFVIANSEEHLYSQLVSRYATFKAARIGSSKKL